MRHATMLGLTVGLTALTIASAQAAPAEPVRGAPDFALQESVRESYIVRFRDGAGPADVRGRANEIAGAVGGRLGFVYTNALRGFSVTLPPGAVDAIFRRFGDVESIERDGIMSIVQGRPGGGGGSGSETMPWGITRVTGYRIVNGEARDAAGQKLTNEPGRRVCVIDTGIDLDHPDLTVDGSTSQTFVAGTTSADDGNGHGTHVAGTIGAKANNGRGVVGVAPGATLIAVRVLGSSGSGTTSGVIAGVDYVAGPDPKCSVANMSLGGSASESLDTAVRNAAAAGVKFAIAAGNSSADANNYSPARVNGTNVCTVSAFSQTNDTFASFSNFGNPPIDWSAPGVSVNSTYRNGGYKSLNGTSMAAPHVAGLLALNLGVTNNKTVTGDRDNTPDKIPALGGSAAINCN